jgi:fermentation-respiration switch protein FrsA (DUF1100 family)
MKRWLKASIWVVVVAMLAGGGYVGYETKTQAHRLITNPRATRRVPTKTPADFQVPYEDVTVTTSDGLNLVGWYLPSPSGVAVMFVHGYKDSRGNMVESAAMYHRHGYGVLLLSLRAHDRSDGEMLTFGHEEMKDLEAWYRYLAARPDVKPDRIGMLGVSMGGALAIQYAAGNPHVQAVVADCAFSSMNDTIATSVRWFTGLPPFPFAPLIAFWAGREGGFSVSEIDAKHWIGRLSPRPVFLMQGGADKVISPQSGELLYQAAGDPKELWFDPALGHAKFFAERRDEYERRVLGFWDKYLGKEH